MPADDNHAELLKEALAAIRRQKAQIQALQAGAQEPVAVVGIGCLLPPDLRGPAAFWAARHTPAPAAAPLPAGRDWFGRIGGAAAHPPEVPVRRGGVFLRDVLGFDAAALGISRREAESMDPQHRALLEVVWHALEDAQTAPDRLARSATGVFVGLMNHDWGHLACAALADIRVHTAAGNGLGVAAGRVAHAFGFTGPAIALDTNCASSLVAVHLAAASLRQRECQLALAAGVNLVLSPAMNVVMGKANALSPTDRCRSFDARGDGYARGEGCGAVVLKRLSDALAAGDRIYAVLRGSAVNHGGHASALSVPSVHAQEAVMRRALQAAGVAPGEVDYLEAHGTGTPLGDPVELEAIQRAYGAGRAAPLHLGCVKNRLGHQEGAAGIVSFIRAVLALHGQEIPPFGEDFVPTPHFDWAASGLAVAPGGRPWPRGERARRAAVSAFGFSGTNCHAVLEEAPAAAAAQPSPAPAGALRLCLSAASRRSLELLAADHAALLDGCAEAEAHALCAASQRARAALPWRVALQARSAAALAARLRAPLQAVRCADAPETAGRVRVWLGGAQDWYARLARQLWPQREFAPAGDPHALPRLQAAVLGELRALGFQVDAVVAEGPAQAAAAWAAGVVGEDDALALHALQRDGGAARTDGAAALPARARPGDAAFDLADADGPIAWADWCAGAHRAGQARPAGQAAPSALAPPSATVASTPAPDALPLLPLGATAQDAARFAGQRLLVAALAAAGDPLEELLDAMVQLFLLGGSPRWDRLPRAPLPAALFVPPYPFDRKPFFVAGTACDPDVPDAPPHGAFTTPAPTAPAVPGRPTADAVLAFLRDALAELADESLRTAPADATWAQAGVDSLIALELRSRVAKAYGVQLAPQLLQGGTLRDCAEAVAAQWGSAAQGDAPPHAGMPPPAQDAGPFFQLVPVRPVAQPRRTLVLVHAVGGTVQAYGALARRLDADTSVLAIGNMPLPPGAPALSIPRMAADYLALVDAAAPQGELLLGGWSMGGLLALEMAALARRRGRPAARVLLIDSIVVQDTADARAADPHAVTLSVFALELGLAAQDLREAERQSAALDGQLAWLRARAVERGLLAAAVPVEDLAWHFRLLRQNFEALTAFRPATYDDAVDYVLAGDALPGVLAQSRHLSAGELRGPLRQWRVPGGNHFSLMREPHVAVLAQLLQAALRQPAASEQPEPTA